MRRLALLALGLSLLALPATSALGRPTPGPVPDGFGSKNVEYIKLVEDEQLHGIGARLVGRYLYVTSVKTLTIYDVSKPTAPKLMSRTPIGGWENEDVATNGSVLIFADTRPNILRVFNVEDKTNPVEIADVPDAASHTMECLFDCKWLYGSTGLIVDIRNPEKPILQKEKWTDVTPFKDSSYPSHDLVEVRPGVLLTSSNPVLLLDARKDLLHPKIVATGDPGDTAFVHSAMWPQHGTDKIMMSAGETNATPRCELGSAAFRTWDASSWKRTHTFHTIDSFTLHNGTATDGNPPVNGMGCSTHWFEQNPAFNDGGIVGLGAYDHGTRFLHITPAGKIHEAGYFMPVGAETSALHWITDRIVYSIDYTRGIDILRYTGPLK
ncbi:MAG: hypothetical protein QOH90_1676 [Actinomycetota bacterium]|jgi:hypothetical protein|nr:hypothetical protein [Actinomycetota bacterium]